MGKWSLISCLGVAAAGVLAFLRLVANEIAVVEHEADYLRKRELAKKRPSQAEVVAELSAA